MTQFIPCIRQISIIQNKVIVNTSTIESGCPDLELDLRLVYVLRNALWLDILYLEIKFKVAKLDN